MRVRVGLFVWLVPLTPGFAQSAGQSAPGHARRTGVAVQRRARPDEFFAHPEELCKALNSVGIETGEWDQIGWNPLRTGGPFMCQHSGTPPVSDAAPVDRDAYRYIGTLFRVSGDTGSRADVISIAVSITAPSARATGQDYFGGLLAALFQSIGQQEPPSLIRAIAGRRYYLSHRTYGIVWFNFVTPDHPGYQRVFWFRLSKSGPG